jgi:hypothetical protein
VAGSSVRLMDPDLGLSRGNEPGLVSIMNPG